MSKKLSETPFVHETAEVSASSLGRYTEIAERCRVSEAVLGDYSYMMQDCGVWCATIGKFANIAAAVRINATNHPTWRPTLHHFTYVPRTIGTTPSMSKFFDMRRSSASLSATTLARPRLDILPGVTVGDGAAVGAGAVVSKDVALRSSPACRKADPRPLRPQDRRTRRPCVVDWDHAKLRAALDDFRHLSAEAFLEKHGG